MLLDDESYSRCYGNVFHWYFGRTNFRSNSADLRGALKSTPFMPDVLERNMV
jgi:hypothetical protein